LPQAKTGKETFPRSNKKQNTRQEQQLAEEKTNFILQ
jgi:hypothetical protein